jgi:uncharacterized membrane protein YkvA (DUF1232 family)
VARASRADRETRRESRTGDHRGIGARRLLGWAALLPIASRAPQYGHLFIDLVRDERTPLARKAALAGAVGYLVVGRDLIPDDLPLIGGLDDLIVVVLAVDLFLDGVPDEVLDEKLEALGVDRRAFEEDVRRIRRFTPAPLRRIVRRLPDAVAFAGEALHHSQLGPKLRGWINKEGSIA